MIHLYYEEPGIQIYYGSALDLLPGMPKINAIITDPPYGIGWSRGTWNDNPEDYPNFIRWFVTECQWLVPHGWCFVFQAMPNVGQFHKWFPEGWRIYAACKNFAQIRPTGIWHSWDPVVFWANGKAPRNPEAVNRDYHVGNVAGCFRHGNNHPCPKPLDTMRHIVTIATLPSMTILDPFMGSGTTLIAAKETGRLAIGIDNDEASCQMAADRVRQTTPALDEAHMLTQEALTFDE